ncbi:MAG: prepilin-type N-terminal cleavage/methylation domain-containing protein [Desulfobacteraceae bacterium]|nr:MAG: prepilin-type N-terminal cleavage/methylation domain-containing protein [Desulfobacteraceae bacterium]
MDAYRKKEGGFTIIELLIAMTVGLIVMSAVISTFIIQQKTFDVQEHVTEMVQNARSAMDLMTREILMAGYNPMNAAFDGVTYNTSELKIQADLDGDGTAAGADEIIVYSYNSGTKQIERTTGTGGAPLPLAEDIQSFSFQYLNGSGAATTTNADIRQVKIVITARTSKIDPGYDSNGGHRTFALSSLITPKNLAF